MGRIGGLNLRLPRHGKPQAPTRPAPPGHRDRRARPQMPLQAVATQRLHEERDACQIDLDDPLQDRDLASPPALVIGLRQRAEPEEHIDRNDGAFLMQECCSDTPELAQDILFTPWHTASLCALLLRNLVVVETPPLA